MSASHALEALRLAVDHIVVPDGYATESAKVDDEILQNSIRITGIQQPLIVTRVDESRYYVVDGVRRLSVALSLGMQDVPCVVDHGVDDVKDRDEYRNRIRFILSEHRQDLLPTQRAKLIRQLQKTFGMTSREVGLYLGVTSGTISNWTLIEKVIPEIQNAIDDGDMKVHAARAFAGMTEAGQREIWEHHRDAALTMSGGRMHKWVRENYPPSEHPEKYVAPDKIIRQLNRPEATRNAKKRATVSSDKKSSMLKDFQAKKIETEDKQIQIKALEDDINAAIAVIEAIRGDDELWECIPESVRSDFDQFAERYIA